MEPGNVSPSSDKSSELPRRALPTKPKPPVPLKTNLVKLLAQDSLKTPKPSLVLSYKADQVTTTFKPNVATPKPIPPPKPKKKGAEMQVDSTKPISTESPKPVATETPRLGPAETLGAITAEIRMREAARTSSNATVEALECAGGEGVATREPSHFTLVGGSPLASPLTCSPAVVTVLESGPSHLTPGRGAMPPTQIAGSPKFGRRANKETLPPDPGVHSLTSRHRAHLDSAPCVEEHGTPGTRPDHLKEHGTPRTRPDHLKEHGTPGTRPDHLKGEITTAEKDSVVNSTIPTSREATPPVQTASSLLLGGHAHREASPPIQIATSPKFGRRANADASSSPRLGRPTSVQTSSTMESSTPPKATPTERSATPPCCILSTPLQAAPAAIVTTSIPAAAGSRASLMSVSKPYQEGTEQPTPVHHSPLTLSTIPPPSHSPLPPPPSHSPLPPPPSQSPLPPPSYSPPPPPPLSPLGESIAAFFSLNEGLLDTPKAEQLQKTTPPDQERVEPIHAKDGPCDVTSSSASPILDDGIYSVVGQVAPIVATTTEGILESEYSVIEEASDGEGEGRDGCGQDVHDTSPEAKVPIRSQLPPPPPLSEEPSSSCYSTVGSVPGGKARVATTDPRSVPGGKAGGVVTTDPCQYNDEEQSGYFVVGPDTVRSSLVLNGHRRRKEESNDMYSHLAEPPRAPPGGARAEGKLEGDVDTYSHLVDPSLPSKAAAAASNGMKPGGDENDGVDDEETYSCVVDPPCSAPHSSISGNGNHRPASSSFTADSPPSSSLPSSGSRDQWVAPARPSNTAGVKVTTKMHIYETPDNAPGGDGGDASLGSSPKTKHQVAKGTPPPGGKKRSMTIIPRRPPPAIPNPLPTPPSPSSVDALRKKEVTKGTEEGKKSPDVKESKKPKKNEGGGGMLGKIFKFGRNSGSDQGATSPVEPSPASIKTSTLPSSGRHALRPSVAVMPVERSSSVDDGAGEEVIGFHSYSVVKIDDVVARRNTQIPPQAPGTTAALKKSDPLEGDRNKLWKSSDELSSPSLPSLSHNAGEGKELDRKQGGSEEGSSTRGSSNHLYDCVDNVTKSPLAGRRRDEKKPVPLKTVFMERSGTQGRTRSVRVAPSTPPPPRGQGRSHVYEAMDDSFLSRTRSSIPSSVHARSSSLDFAESSNHVAAVVTPVTTPVDQSSGWERNIPVPLDPTPLYAQVDKSNRKKEGEEALSPSSTPDVPGDKPGEEEEPPIVPTRTEHTDAVPSSPSPPPPLPEPLATFSIAGDESSDQPDGGNVSGHGKVGRDASTGGACSPPQSIQHTLSSQGAVYAVILKDKGSGHPLPPPPQASSDTPVTTATPPVTTVTPPVATIRPSPPMTHATHPPRPPPFASRGTSGTSLDGTYAVCGGTSPLLPTPHSTFLPSSPPLLPPRSPLEFLDHTHAQPPTKPLPAIPTSKQSETSLGSMDPTYAVPDIVNRTTAAAAGDRPQATPTPKVPTVIIPTRPLPPIISSPSGGHDPFPLGIMDPEYATPGMSYVVSVATAGDIVMGHFHMKEGLEVTSPPPSTAMQDSGESDSVEQRPPAPMTQAKDPGGLSTVTSKSKKPKKHSYEEVLDEAPPPVPLGASPPNQSLTLLRKLALHPGEGVVQSKPTKTRAKSLKPKNKPAPEPPKMAGGLVCQNVPLGNSPPRSDGNKEEASGTGEEAPPTKPCSGTLYDDSGSSDSEYSSGEEEEGEESLFASTDNVMSEAKGGGKRAKTFYIAQEMLTTERTYVKGLRLLHDDFRAWISENDKPVIPDDVLKQILGNIGSLVGLNSGLLSDLEARMANWDEDPRVGDIMASKAPYLKLYTEYISKFDKALKALEDAKKKYSQFAELLRDFEAEPKCANLPLASYMLEVVQRIPRYKLLLADYVKHLPVDSPDRKPSETALEIISHVASHVNDTMKRMDNFKKVIEVCKKLSGDTGDSLITPYRKLIREGELLKSCRKEKQMKMFFLFNDLLLYCISHPPGLTYKVVMRIPVDGMRVQPLNDPDMKHGFQIISTCKSFRLEASSAEECQQWIDAIKNAIRESSEIEANKAIVRAKSISKTGRMGELGHFAPAWLPDNSVSMCQMCSVHFTLTKRRHHCRACGMIFCAECAGYVVNLKYLDNKPGRVCHTCCTKLKGGAHSEDSSAISPHKHTKKLSDKQLSMPAVLTEVKARDRSAQISGYLFTHKSRTKRWKKRWYVVYNLVLYEFVRHEDVVAKRTITLPSYKVIAPSEGKEDTLIFSLKHPGTTVHYFKAENVELLKTWCEVLSRAVQGDCSIPEVPQTNDD